MPFSGRGGGVEILIQVRVGVKRKGVLGVGMGRGGSLLSTISFVHKSVVSTWSSWVL